MRRFEYDLTIELIKNAPGTVTEIAAAVEKLNERGRDGWELVQSDAFPIGAEGLTWLYRIWKRERAGYEGQSYDY